MYEILKTDGSIIGVTENLLFIRIHENGCYVQCDEKDAQGIAYKGNPYPIIGHTEIAGEPVTFFEFNSAEEIDENKNAIADAEDAVCNLDMDLTTRLTDIENALCDLDSALT